MMTEQRLFKCSGCGHAWGIGHGVQRPEVCPSCGSANIHRISPGGGVGGGMGGGGRCRGLRTGLHREGTGMGQGGGGAHEHDHNHDHDHSHNIGNGSSGAAEGESI